MSKLYTPVSVVHVSLTFPLYVLTVITSVVTLHYMRPEGITGGSAARDTLQLGYWG